MNNSAGRPTSKNREPVADARRPAEPKAGEFASAKNARALKRIYDLLYAAYGPQNWWPGETPFEIALGAVLTQNTSWKNVEKAIAAVRAAGALDENAMRALSSERLEELLKPSGYFRVKTRRVAALLRFFAEAGSLDGLRPIPTPALRRRLLNVYGQGPETADSILLYALNRSVFVVDAYTRRVLSRHGLIQGTESYELIRTFCQANLPRSRPLYNEFHALLVRVGNLHCKPNPRCAGCPLAKIRAGLTWKPLKAKFRTDERGKSGGKNANETD
jgi:endonuclease-3 related protein